MNNFHDKAIFDLKLTSLGIFFLGTDSPLNKGYYDPALTLWPDKGDLWLLAKSEIPLFGLSNK